MASRFEALLYGDHAPALRAAGEEALEEIQRLDRQLSLFRPGSEISELNRLAAERPVRVTPSLFRLLQHARQLWLETQGAFDITVAPLMRCWGFWDGPGHCPSPDQWAEARACVGMQHVHFDEPNFTVAFDRPGVMLDLGAMGKGYALDQAADRLREAGVVRGIIHGGTSTVLALGQPPDADAWRVAIPAPEPGQLSSVPLDSRPVVPGREHLAVVTLRDESLSVAAIWGRAFAEAGQLWGHEFDPRRGEPVQDAWLAAVVLGSATETDALSTALLVADAAGGARILGLRPALRALRVVPAAPPGTWSVCRHGL